MPDYQHIDYRLRCHTKRTDLPADVLRDIGEAYAEIVKSQREIERLRKERDEARRLYCGAVEEIEHGMTNETKRMVADFLGWDCFKENTNV